jgi:hypothetical protein
MPAVATLDELLFATMLESAARNGSKFFNSDIFRVQLKRGRFWLLRYNP